jgi:hypothetical protein
VYISGTAVTLTNSTLSGNLARGGNGGNGLPGVNTPIALGHGMAGNGGFGGDGQVGGRLEYLGDLFSASLVAKVALGSTTQRLDVSGSSTLLAPGQPPVTVPGGVLALPSNIGRQNHSSFSVVPEVGVNLGLRLTEHVQARVGYSFLYWTDVARPGNQIDRVLDRTTLPTVQDFIPGATGTRPAPRQELSDFWAHGVNAGLEISY